MNSIQLVRLVVVALGLGACAPGDASGPAPMEPAEPAYAVASDYSIPFDLGPLPGANEAGAAAINEVGHAAGTSHYMTTAGPTYRAVAWLGNGPINLGTLPGMTESVALDLNVWGVVVGYSCSPCRPFIWNSVNGMKVLPSLSGQDARARAINNASVAVGSARTANGILHAVKWTAAGQIVDLHPATAYESFADDINDAGVIAGRINMETGGQQFSFAVTWNAAGQLSILGPQHPPFGGLDIALSSNGWIAGNYTPGIPDMAFTYSPANKYVLTPGTKNLLYDVNWRGRAVGSHDGVASFFVNGTWWELPGLGGASSLAVGVNNCGTIVGQATNAAGWRRPVRWSRRVCDTARGS
jgi:uncharacterized membrane protein